MTDIDIKKQCEIDYPPKNSVPAYNYCVTTRTETARKQKNKRNYSSLPTSNYSSSKTPSPSNTSSSGNVIDTFTYLPNAAIGLGTSVGSAVGSNAYSLGSSLYSLGNVFSTTQKTPDQINREIDVLENEIYACGNNGFGRDPSCVSPKEAEIKKLCGTMQTSTCTSACKRHNSCKGAGGKRTRKNKKSRKTVKKSKKHAKKSRKHRK